jgi:1-acyl-sn-glycerol-3-phosphate acyltransferase
MPLILKARVFNRHYEPATGGVVYICNHQSYLDPLLMAFALTRPMNFMARKSLFGTPGFRQLIESVNTFPVDRESSGISGLKEAMRRIKRGGQVVVFPEGTRTFDGRIAPFQPGVAMLSQRVADWTVPVVIDGGFEAWPRTQLLPRFGNIVVQYGPPIAQKVARDTPASDFLEMVRQQMIQIQSEIRRRVGRAPLEYE